MRGVEPLDQQVDQVALRADAFVVPDQQREGLRLRGLLEQHVLKDFGRGLVAGVFGQPQPGERHAELIARRDVGQQRQRLRHQAAEAVPIAQADVVVEQRPPDGFVGGRAGPQAFEQLRAQTQVAGARGPLGEIAGERHHAFERHDTRRALQDARSGVRARRRSS